MWMVTVWYRLKLYIEKNRPLIIYTHEYNLIELTETKEKKKLFRPHHLFREFSKYLKLLLCVLAIFIWMNNHFQQALCEILYCKIIDILFRFYFFLCRKKCTKRLLKNTFNKLSKTDVMFRATCSSSDSSCT